MAVYSFNGSTDSNHPKIELLQIPVLAFVESWNNFDPATQQPLTLTLSGAGGLIMGRLKKAGTIVNNGNIAYLPNLCNPLSSVGSNASWLTAALDNIGTVAGLETLNTAINISGRLGFNKKGSHDCFLLDINTAYKTDKKTLGVYYKQFSNDRVSIAFPANTGKVLKVCFFFHGAGDDYLSHLTGVEAPQATWRLMQSTLNALINDGWTVVSSDAGTTLPLHWGSPNSATATGITVEWLKSNFTIGKMVVLGQSMGGLSSLRALVENPSITKWYGIYPVCNVLNMQANGVYGTSVNAAYAPSGGVSANLVACDPMSMPVNKFAGKSLAGTCSNGDTIVPASQHLLNLKTRLSAVTTIAEFIHTGDHGDLTAFRPTDVINFFNSP